MRLAYTAVGLVRISINFSDRNRPSELKGGNTNTNSMGSDSDRLFRFILEYCAVH